jgi:hypothetical protein
MKERRYNDAETRRMTEDTMRDGFCILRDHLPKAKIAVWGERFAPLLAQHIEREGQLMNRGPGRFYVTLPFGGPFADEDIFCGPDVLTIVENLVGQDFKMVQLATDTPVRGSDYQDIHRDAPPLFPEWGRETPPFQLALNFPLIDVTPENGPFEVARGTHLMSKEDGMREIKSGGRPLEPICLKAGDIMIRDVRGLHRGTPNQTGTPRPMVVIGYSRKWLLRPEVSIRIPRGIWDGLSDQARHLLRYNQIVDSLDAPAEEIYQSFAY